MLSPIKESEYYEKNEDDEGQTKYNLRDYSGYSEKVPSDVVLDEKHIDVYQRSVVVDESEPLARCSVLYLGTAIPPPGLIGIDSIQEPLSKRFPVDGKEVVRGIEAWLSIDENGFQIQFVSDPLLMIYYPIHSLVYCAGVRFATQTSTGEAFPNGWRFVPLDTPDASHIENTQNPPLFAITFERTRHLPVHECHCFVAKTKQTALALVQACCSAYKSTTLEQDCSKVPLYFKVSDDGSDIKETDDEVCMLPALAEEETSNYKISSKGAGYFYTGDRVVIDVWQLWESRKNDTQRPSSRHGRQRRLASITSIPEAQKLTSRSQFISMNKPVEESSYPTIDLYIPSTLNANHRSTSDQSLNSLSSLASSRQIRVPHLTSITSIPDNQKLNSQTQPIPTNNSIQEPVQQITEPNIPPKPAIIQRSPSNHSLNSLSSHSSNRQSPQHQPISVIPLPTTDEPISESQTTPKPHPSEEESNPMTHTNPRSTPNVTQQSAGFHPIKSNSPHPSQQPTPITSISDTQKMISQSESSSIDNFIQDLLQTMINRYGLSARFVPHQSPTIDNFSNSSFNHSRTTENVLGSVPLTSNTRENIPQSQSLPTYHFNEAPLQPSTHSHASERHVDRVERIKDVHTGQEISIRWLGNTPEVPEQAQPAQKSHKDMHMDSNVDEQLREELNNAIKNLVISGKKVKTPTISNDNNVDTSTISYSQKGRASATLDNQHIQTPVISDNTDLQTSIALDQQLQLETSSTERKKSKKKHKNHKHQVDEVIDESVEDHHKRKHSKKRSHKSHRHKHYDVIDESVSSTVQQETPIPSYNTIYPAVSSSYIYPNIPHATPANFINMNPTYWYYTT